MSHMINPKKFEIEWEEGNLKMYRNSKWIFIGLCLFNAFMVAITGYALYKHGSHWNSLGIGISATSALYSLVEWKKYKRRWKNSKRRLHFLTEINWDNNWDKNL